MSNYDHFTSFVINFNFINNFSFQFDKNKVYYHDGLKNKGMFLKYDNYNEMFKKNKKLVPNIMIYQK